MWSIGDMMTDRELMQQALEAMEYADACLKKQLTTKTKHEYAQDLLMTAGTALRDRLAQPEQAYWNAVEGWVKIDEVREHFDSVGCGVIYKTAGEDRTPLYTAPPQRKPLTDEEIDRVTDQQWAQNNHKPIYAAHRAYARAVEAAHGIGEKK